MSTQQRSDVSVERDPYENPGWVRSHTALPPRLTRTADMRVYKGEHRNYTYRVMRRLKARVKAMGYTQRQVDNLFGWTTNQTQKLLGEGVASPTFLDVVQLANLVGTDLNYLGELTGLYDNDRIVDPAQPATKLKLSAEELELLESLVRDLTDEERHELLDDVFAFYRRKLAERKTLAWTPPSTRRATRTQQKQQSDQEEHESPPAPRVPVPTAPR